MAPRDRDQFLRDDAAELAKHELLGPGLVARVVAKAQRRYFDPPQFHGDHRFDLDPRRFAVAVRCNDGHRNRRDQPGRDGAGANLLNVGAGVQRDIDGAIRADGNFIEWDSSAGLKSIAASHMS